MNIHKITNFLDKELNSARFSHDSSNNGLQVEAATEIKKIALAVDSAFEVFVEAQKIKADLLITHHGISWGSYPKLFNGITGKRLQFLFNHNISLYASHLPLDANLKFGNNIELAKMISLDFDKMFFEYDGVEIGVLGKLKKSLHLGDIRAIYEDRLDTKSRIHGSLEDHIKTIAICSGGGGMESLIAAKEAGADLLVTGEFNHTMYHLRKELDINVVSLGHYASETVGIKALGQLINDELGIPCEFINIPTGL